MAPPNAAAAIAAAARSGPSARRHRFMNSSASRAAAIFSPEQRQRHYSEDAEQVGKIAHRRGRKRQVRRHRKVKEPDCEPGAAAGAAIRLCPGRKAAHQNRRYRQAAVQQPQAQGQPQRDRLQGQPESPGREQEQPRPQLRQILNGPVRRPGAAVKQPRSQQPDAQSEEDAGHRTPPRRAASRPSEVGR